MPKTSSITIEQVKRVLDISRLFAVTTDLDPLLTRIAQAACGILACERASIFIHDAQAQQLWSKIALGADEIRVPDSSGIVGHAFTQNKIVADDNPYENPQFDPTADKRSGFITRSLLAAPMLDIDGRPLGVLQAVNKDAGRFSEVDRSLIELLANQAGVAIQRYRLQVAAMEIVSLRSEMALARGVQEQMIPRQAPVLPGLIAAGRAVPASITGGDCYDLWITRSGGLGILLADAVGHGLRPALIVSQARTLVRGLSELEADPQRVMHLVNYRLFGDLDGGGFVTAFFGTLSPGGELNWFSAGHGPIFLREDPGVPLQALPAHVPPLGCSQEIDWLKVPPVEIKPGGFLAVVSDGILEAFDPAQNQFGAEKLRRILETEGARPPELILEKIFASVQAWQQSAEPRDDQTLVIVTRTNE
jgi:sigma-B regulation protein RsbU (phosphoserine phosphatase)